MIIKYSDVHTYGKELSKHVECTLNIIDKQILDEKDFDDLIAKLQLAKQEFINKRIAITSAIIVSQTS